VLSAHKRLGGLAAILALVGFGLSGGTVLATTQSASADDSVIPEAQIVDLNPPGPEMLYTQGFLLQNCSFKSRGINPFFDVLIPGLKHVSVKTDEDGIEFRKEYRVLRTTERFNRPGIGRFRAAVIEEREIFGATPGAEPSVLRQISINWYAICEETNSVFTVGENSFQLNDDGTVNNTEGTWRAGTPHPRGMAIPAIAMPGIILLGSRYIFDGAPGVAFGGAEIVAYDLETVDGKLTTEATDFYEGEEAIEIPITAEVGDFSGCVQIEELSQNNEPPFGLQFDDPTNKVWCPDVGLIYDTSDGALAESNLLTDEEFMERVDEFKEDD
jgi:hypothetical protein